MDLNVISELSNLAGESFDLARLIDSQEVVRSEISIRQLVSQEVIGGGEDRSGDGQHRLLGTATRPQAKELCLQVAVLLAARSPRALHQHRLKPQSSFAKSARHHLTGAFVQA